MAANRGSKLELCNPLRVQGRSDGQFWPTKGEMITMWRRNGAVRTQHNGSPRHLSKRQASPYGLEPLEHRLLLSGPPAPVLDALSDSGLSNSDRITNVAAPTFQVNTGDNPFRFYIDSAQVPGDFTGATFVVAGPLSDGDHTFQVSQVVAGIESELSDSTVVTIDTIAPATPAPPALINDTGLSHSDGITKATVPAFTVGASSPYRLYQDGLLVSDAYATEAFFGVAKALSDGTYVFGNTSLDVAGNESAASTQTVVVDTTAPVSHMTSPNVAGPSLKIELSWAAEPDLSGIAYYDLFAEGPGYGLDYLPQTTLTSATFTGAAGQTYTFFTIATDVAGNVERVDLANAMTATVWQMRTIEVKKSHATDHYIDAAGNRFNVTWSGSRGSAVLLQWIDPATTNGDLYSLSVSGSTASSSVRVAAAHSGVFSNVEQVSVESPLGGLNLAALDVTTSVTTAGQVGTIRLGDLDDVAIDLNGMSKAGVNLYVRQVTNTTLDADGRLAKLTAFDWQGGSITATRATTVSITGSRAEAVEGDFDADLTLALEPNKPSLYHLTVAGDLAGSWDIAGPVTYVKARNATLTGAIAGSLATLRVTGDMQDTDITRDSLPDAKISGSMLNSTLNLTKSKPDRGSAKTLGKLVVLGWMQDSSVLSAGNVGSVKVGGLQNAQLYAGVQDGVTGLADPTSDLAAVSARLDSVTVTGAVADPDGFNTIGSCVCASNIGKVSYNRVNVSTGGAPFGTAANKLTSAYYRNSAGKVVRLAVGNIQDFWTDVRPA